ncbi:uncharacterized protein PHACADRAFT_152301 [Phanerochaete carnosa HHB-10118-sp]|uniref:SET domain-containing protein n=1 Tax=Phanerochaete carnosa (strain HHB-10118-sp) TaxID=650164 RepID=K5VUY8_PHACS|nr:uncharacterized protein PHACADRAFT_152301 [Phanerochaete carnosa HHB-10118-sp]EKM50379.1 hypothetical protein PHACADRAFT_152301 [Phanerochaete carnosa HHB-10118-sp]
MRQYYTDTVVPVLSRPGWTSIFAAPPALSFAGFLHSYSLVSSRSFLVDAYHTLAMVPIADAFNHTVENHIHLESEFDVCVSCGSLAQCPHDLEEDNENVPIGKKDPSNAPSTRYLDAGPRTQWRRTAQANACPTAAAEPVLRFAHPNDDIILPTRTTEEADTCDMVSNRLIPAGEEVFNTYGEQLTNAQLLARYGFALDGNENDIVGFEWADMQSAFGAATERLVLDQATLLRNYQRALAIFPKRERWGASNLVYQPDNGSSAISTPDPVDGGLGRHHEHDCATVPMAINSDAKISQGLWFYCSMLAVVDARRAQGQETDPCEVAAVAERLARSQLLFEARPDSASWASSDADTYDDEERGDPSRYEGTEELDRVCFAHCLAGFHFRLVLLACVWRMISCCAFAFYVSV